MIIRCCRRIATPKVYRFGTGRRGSARHTLEQLEYQEDIKYPEKRQQLRDLETVLKFNIKELDKQFHNKDSTQGKKQEEEENRWKKSITVWTIAGILMFLNLSGPNTKEAQVAFEFNSLEEVESVEIATFHGLTSENNDAIKYQATILYKDGRRATQQIVNPNAFLAYLEEKQKGKTVFIPVHFRESKNLAKSFWDHGFHILINVALIYYVVRMRFKLPTQFFFGDFRKGKSIIATDIKVRFDQVAGMDQAKKEIQEIVEFLKSSAQFKRMGARIPKGALLTGPPGTGKTMLAKACAKQSNASFYSMSGSDFIEMYGGMGASRVRELFATAKLNAPSIIFIDQIDTIGSKRHSSNGNMEKDSTLNQMLVQMDGFNTDTNVIVMAATNRKEILDDALLRPGRFDRIIQIDLPDLEGRKQVFKVHLQPIKINPNTTIEQMAERLSTLTPGFSGADIANLCNEAAILASRRDSEYVDKLDFEMASERVMAGMEKKNLMTEETKRTVAYHEAGHAVVGWLCEGGDPVVKVTIVPRSKGSLGFAQYLPSQNKLQSKSVLIDRMAIALGGRLTEDIFFNRITVGAADDLQKVHAIGRSMVTRFGMSQKIGNVSLQSDGYINTYSDKTAKQIDQELFHLVQTAEVKARKVIGDNKDKIQKLAEMLIEKETITNKELEEVLGPRPFQTVETQTA